MEPKLQAALEALADCVFAADDPTPVELEKRRKALLPNYISLASLALNIRLTLRWYGFGVAHTNVTVQPLTSSGGVPVRIRVYDPASMEIPIRHLLTHAGFHDISYHAETVGMGGSLSTTAPVWLVRRLRG